MYKQMPDRKKTIIKIALSLVLALSLSLSDIAANFIFASSSEEQELDAINKELEGKKGELSEGKKKSNALSAEIKQLEKQIYSTEVELNRLQIDINSTKGKISETLDELAVLEDDISEQNAGLNERLRTMYKNGEVGTLAVLLGSADMSEFMTNMDMLERIYRSDMSLLEQLQDQHEEVVEKKMQLQSLKDSLLAKQRTASEKQEGLESNKGLVAGKKAEIDKDNAVLSNQIDALNAEADALIDKIRAMQGGGSYVGGGMKWPSAASTRISSPFGMRVHPILKRRKMHTGIDIAASGGTDILAANDGVVISAGWNNSYGYMVMIDHGGGIVTLYAHSSKLLVKKGQRVHRGDVIAKVGSTGMSTGNHIHFEVRVDGAYKNPLDYVSP